MQWAHLPGATLCATGAAGGVSPWPWAPEGGRGLNLAFHVGDSPRRVEQNRAILARALSRQILYMDQVHSASVVTISDPRHLPPPGKDLPEVDGIILDLRRWPASEGLKPPALAVMVADCVPAALWSPCGQIGAVFHVGWRGLVGGIVQATLAALEACGAGARALRGGLGPSICASCYQVGKDVYEQVVAGAPAAKAGEGHLDLAGAVAGILQEHSVGAIEHLGGCTQCGQGYFSHRAALKVPAPAAFSSLVQTTGRQALALRLEP